MLTMTSCFLWRVIYLTCMVSFRLRGKGSVSIRNIHEHVNAFRTLRLPYSYCTEHRDKICFGVFPRTFRNASSRYELHLDSLGHIQNICSPKAPPNSTRQGSSHICFSTRKNVFKHPKTQISGWRNHGCQAEGSIYDDQSRSCQFLQAI